MVGFENSIVLLPTASVKNIVFAPTVVKQNGDRIQVLVARDLDFRSVYELRAVGTH